MRKSKKIITAAISALTLSGCTYFIAKASESVNVDYEKTSWEWIESESGYEAKATLYFTNNTSVTLDASVNSKLIREKTCEKDGLLRYTASVVYGGVTLDNNKDIVLEAEGHVFNNYQFDDDFHFTSCICGEINEKESHNFGSFVEVEAPDGWKTPGRKYKECQDCHYKHYETITSIDTYREQVIERTKQTLDNFGPLPEIRDSMKIFNDTDVHQIFEYLTSDEILSLDKTYQKKLLSILFDYNKVIDVDKNGRLIFMTDNDNIAKNDIETTKTYGNVSTIEIKENIANRKEFPGVNTLYKYGASKYTFFQFTHVPELYDKDKELVFYIYAPYVSTVAISCDSTIVNKLIFNSSGSPVGTNYIRFDMSKPDSDESKGYINLNKGWNAVVFNETSLSDLKQRKPYKMQLEIISDEGLKPGTWKFSSFIAKGIETYTLIEQANNLPEEGNVKIYDGTLINDLYSSYLALSTKIDNIFHLKNTLVKLKAEWDSFAALPYGIYKMQNDVDPNLYETAKGKCYKLEFSDTTYNKGVLHLGGGVKKINSPFECLGFYIKGYDGKLSVYNASTSKALLSFNKVSLDDGWNLYFLTNEQVLMLQNYDLSVISWGYLYLHFDDPILPGTIYNSPLYSFMAGSTIYNEIASKLPISDDDLTYSDKEIVDVLFDMLKTMSDSEISKCHEVERVIRLHNNFPIKGVTFEEAKNQLSLSGGTKNDWGHFNNKAVYFNLNDVYGNDLVLSLPKVSYKYYSKFIYQGEMTQGILIGFSSSDHYTQPSGGNVHEFFTITFESNLGKTTMNIKVFATDSDSSRSPDNRSYETFTDVIYNETRDINDSEILTGDKSLELFVKAQYSWSTQFFVGGALMVAK